MTISLYSKTTMASIAVVVASLGLGCGGGHAAEYNSVKNEPVVDLNQDFTVSIIAKNNTLLTYTTEAVTNAQYDWTITDDSNKTLQFYGQGSNEITITDTEIKIGKIKVSCKVERDVISHTDDKQFEVDEHAKARLVLQNDTSKTRASWFTDIRLAKTDEARKAYIDKMKLGNEAASKYLILITDFSKLAGSDSTEEQKKDILTERMAITSFIMHEPIIDELYNKTYPNESLVYPTIVALEERLYSEAKELSININKLIQEDCVNDPIGSLRRARFLHMNMYHNVVAGTRLQLQLSKENPEFKEKQDFRSQLPRVQKLLSRTKDMCHTETFGLQSRLDEWNKEAELTGLNGLPYLSVLEKIVDSLLLRD